MSGQPQYFRRHSLRLGGEGLKIVAASGCEGATAIRLGLTPKNQPGKYVVRLYFAEPKYEKAGERVFDVKLQGQMVLENFDVCKESGGKLRPVMKEFRGVAVPESLVVELASKTGSTLICGIEVVREK